MTIGIPSEIKPSESRVGMTPAGAFELTRRGHTVLVQSGAGLGSGFSDADYTDVGAELRGTIELVYAEADMIVKVKEPIESEYDLIRSGQVVFTYFHFASSASLTEAMVSSGAVCIAYETVEELRWFFAAVDAHVRGGRSDGHPARGQIFRKAKKGTWCIAWRCSWCPAGPGTRAGCWCGGNPSGKNGGWPWSSRDDNGHQHAPFEAGQ